LNNESCCGGDNSWLSWGDPLSSADCEKLKDCSFTIKRKKTDNKPRKTSKAPAKKEQKLKAG
jgi:hypothetical protein